MVLEFLLVMEARGLLAWASDALGKGTFDIGAVRLRIPST